MIFAHKCPENAGERRQDLLFGRKKKSGG